MEDPKITQREVNLEAVKDIAGDAWASAKDRVRAQELCAFDEGRVYRYLLTLIEDRLSLNDTFPQEPEDESESCCTTWNERHDYYNDDFRYCPFCNSEFEANG